ncbi:hypothetical protein DY000_02013083 [Brassica cretica]|uniref:Uncharacterized protein n=1 Tax=Brassica cretica TaxID=69181 RepID=A0ABQ7D5U3_BRACR|nr:hypothetical protein DY000_02013083 [Brassica cretica]
MAEKGDDATSPPPPSLVTITTIAISPIPNRSSPPPLLVEHTGKASPSCIRQCSERKLSSQIWRGSFRNILLALEDVNTLYKQSDTLLKSPRGMTLPKLCPNVCTVVVVTREQELVLCRGDVWNSSPSRLTRILQVFHWNCQVQPLKVL